MGTDSEKYQANAQAAPAGHNGIFPGVLFGFDSGVGALAKAVTELTKINDVYI